MLLAGGMPMGMGYEGFEAGPPPLGNQWGIARGPFGPLPYSPQPAAEEGITTAFVGGFGPPVGEADLFYLFSKCGPVSQIKLPRDKGIAFIIFQHRDAAERAIYTMQGALLPGGYRCRVEWCKFSAVNGPPPAASTSTVYAHRLTVLERAVEVEKDELPPGIDTSAEASKHTTAAAEAIAQYQQGGFQTQFSRDREAGDAHTPLVPIGGATDVDVTTVDGFNAFLASTVMDGLASSAALHPPPEAHTLSTQVLEGAKQAAMAAPAY